MEHGFTLVRLALLIVLASAVATPIAILLMRRRLEQIVAAQHRLLGTQHDLLMAQTAAVAGLRNSIDALAAARQGSPRVVELNINGDLFTRAQVLAMVAQMNSAVRDGARLFVPDAPADAHEAC